MTPQSAVGLVGIVALPSSKIRPNMEQLAIQSPYVAQTGLHVLHRYVLNQAEN
jgi:hypothetical protein